MPRGLHADLIAEFGKDLLHPVFFIEVVTEVGTVRFHSGLGDLSWNSQTWAGVGSLVSISTVKESSQLKAEGLTITLSGIDDSANGLSGYVADLLNELAPDNDVTVWLGALDGPGGTVVSNPFEWFKGLTSHATLLDSAETSTLTLQCEHELIKFQTPIASRLNSEEQKRRYPGDKFFDFLPKLPSKTIVWGTGEPLASGGTGSRIGETDPGHKKAPTGGG